MYSSQSSSLSRQRGLGVFWLLAFIAAFTFLFAAPPAHALAPVGTSINNQAVGTYVDGALTGQTDTSNAVSTIVKQLAVVSLTPNNNKYATVGSTVVFPHTVVNTGNGTDAFNLSAVNSSGGDFDLTLLAVYADADGNGVADNLIPITQTP